MSATTTSTPHARASGRARFAPATKKAFFIASATAPLFAITVMLASSVGEWPLCGLPPRGSLIVAVYKDLPPFNTEDPRFATEPLPSPRAPRNGWAVGCAVKTAPVDLAQGLCGAMNGLAATGKLRKMFAKQHVAWHGT